MKKEDFSLVLGDIRDDFMARAMNPSAPAGPHQIGAAGVRRPACVWSRPPPCC